MIHALITAKCGSHLFGLDTENSDKDYLSLVIPVENEQMEMIRLVKMVRIISSMISLGFVTLKPVRLH